MIRSTRRSRRRLSSLITVVFLTLSVPIGAGPPEELPGVVVRTYCGSSNYPPRLRRIALSHFYTDELANPTGLYGPKVRIVTEGSTAPSEHCSFIHDPNSVQTALVTAFYIATQAIDLAECWTKRFIPWGNDGRLDIVIYRSEECQGSYDFTTKQVRVGLFDREDETVVSISPDVVAHEAGHAIIGALKPGLTARNSTALHEGLADAVAAMIILSDPDVVARVLSDTGGHLQRDNGATRLVEEASSKTELKMAGISADSNPRCLRSLVNSEKLDCEKLDIYDRYMSYSTRFAWRGNPYSVGQCISGALYDLFVSLYEREVAAGTRQEKAVGDARTITGSLMLLALDFVGEHGVALHEYALALLRADSVFYNGENTNQLCTVLVDRGFIRSRDDALAELASLVDSVPVAILSPQYSERDEIFSGIYAIENQQLELIRNIPYWRPEDIKRVPLLFHENNAPFSLVPAADSLMIHHDSRMTDGHRVIRLRYRYCRTLKVDSVVQESADVIDNDYLEYEIDVYTSMLFDKAGCLVAINADNPTMIQPPGRRAYLCRRLQRCF
jgi:hypothetical protein